MDKMLPHWTSVSLPSVFFFLLSCPLMEMNEIHHGHQLSDGGRGSSSSGGGNRVQVNLTVGYMTGSSRKPGDQEYSRPGLTISGALTLAFDDLKKSNFFDNMIVYTNGTKFKRDVLQQQQQSARNGAAAGASVSASVGRRKIPQIDIGFSLEIAETFGNEGVSVRQVANLWRKNVSVIIGPQETCLHEAMFASSFNIPMISYFCSDEETSDKRRFPTFARTRPPDAAISRAVVSLLLKYGWTSSLTLIYSDSSDDQRFRRVARSLSILLQKQNVTTRKEIPYRGPWSYHGRVDNPFDAIVAQTKDKTRIYIVISEYFEHLGFMLAMEKHKLLESGEYLVIGVSIDDYEEDEWNPTRYFKCLLCDEVDKVDPRIFRSYIGIVASPPRNFTDFSHRVNDFMEKEPFNFPNPLKSIGGYKKIRIEAAYLYDAVILYAQALRSIIEDHLSVQSSPPLPISSSSSSSLSSSAGGNSGNNGRSESRTDPLLLSAAPASVQFNNHGIHTSNHGSNNIQSHSHSTIGGRTSGSKSRNHGHHAHGSSSSSGSSSGSTASNHGGGRKSLLARLLDGEEISQRLRNISYRSATGHESEMDERGDAKGNFTLVSLKNKNGQYGLYPVGFFRQSHDLPELQLNEEINWVAGAPPVSEPRCGFSGEKCKRDHNAIIIFSVLFVLAILLVSGAYLIFRHWRLSRDMDTLLWRIDKKDIHWENGQFFPINRGSQASLAKFSTVFAPLVTYRERIFAAKAMDTDFLDSNMKHQLKLLREIRHENLNPFIGACLYDEGILLIQEYCSRGSIKDILDNGDLKLDDMFVSSLVGDLLRGLSYLHDSSQFRYHGNLKPTNCLVDSRWVLRLTDFGLTYARRGHYLSHHPHHATTDMIIASGNASSAHHQGKHGSIGGTRVSFSAAPTAGVGTGAAATTTTMTTTTMGTTTTTITRTGSGNYNSSVRSAPRTVRVVTSPYLPPEFSEIICKSSTSSNKSVMIDNYRKGDIYSLGVILWELLRRESLATFLGIKEEREIRAEVMMQGNGFWTQNLSHLVQEPSIVRNATTTTTSGANNCPPPPPPPPPNPSATAPPSAGTNCIIPPTVMDCLRDCLNFDPDQRPDIKSVRMRLRPLHKGMRSNIFDIMIGLMEKYANNLEILVDERTKQLSEEKRKTESLLYELIPAAVAEELKEGLRVPAQNYDCVSIYFSDIVGFTSMSAQSSPLEVVEFLNDLYTCFDSVIENFDVYKVETIGDAYMVASGLPVVRAGNFHAHEMARMALQLLETVTNFRIRHRPNETVKLRIGVHSGPCCAGVVGLKRPRYCLFGDTVNTASRMESTGLPLKIHCSEAFASLVEDGFLVQRRGVVDVKGKGDMTTFWLLGPKPSSNNNNNNNNSINTNKNNNNNSSHNHNRNNNKNHNSSSSQEQQQEQWDAGSS